MPTDQYAYTGSPPPAPEAVRSDHQRRYSPAAAAATATAPAAQPATTAYGVSAHMQVQYPMAAGPASPLQRQQHNQQQQRNQQQRNQQQQHNQQRRRLSNAPSDGTAEGRAPPAAALPRSDRDTTSEDEIESLKRDMGSDLWALQRQRMRREQHHLHNRPRPSGSTAAESSGSPLAQDTSPVFKGKGPAAPLPPAHQSHYPPPGLALHPQISPRLPEFAAQEWAAYVDSAGPAEPAMASAYPAVPFHRHQHQPQPPPQLQPQSQPLHAHDASYAYLPAAPALLPYPPAAYAHHQPQPPLYAHHPHHVQATQAFSAAAAALAAHASASVFAHGRQPTTAPPLPPIVDATAASRDYSVPGYLTDAAAHYNPQQWPVGGYHPVTTSALPADTTTNNNGSRYESASVRSNDQMSGSHTDISGYSQAYRPHHAATNPFAAAVAAAASATAASHGGGYSGSNTSAEQHLRPIPEQAGVYPTPQQRYHQYQYQYQSQSPTQQQAHALAHSPLHAAGSPPMEQKRLHAVASDSVHSPAAHSGNAPTRTDHVTGQPSMAAYPPPPLATARVSPPMQEMQEHHSTFPLASSSSPAVPPALLAPAEPAAPVGTNKTSSAITIQSLLNSPLAGEFTEAAGAGGGEMEAAAIHQHIAKENARFRQNSSALGHPSIPAHMTPSPPTAHHHGSSPNSRSSYHSAGYSAWHGRAETVNLDFATAQQSLSSMDGAGLGLSITADSQHRQHAVVYYTDAPLPTIPASFARATLPPASAIESAPPRPLPLLSLDHNEEYGFDYYKPTHRRDSKPISVLVQVSDNSPKGSVSCEAASPPPDSPMHLSQEVAQHHNTEVSLSAVDGDMGRVAEDVMVRVPLARKGTNESLDNVLEYYRTHPDALDKRASAELGTLLSTSNGAGRAHSPLRAGDNSRSQQQQQQRHTEQWPGSNYSSLRTIPPPADSSVLGTHPHTREQTPLADSARASNCSPPSRLEEADMHGSELLLSVRHWSIDVGDSYLADVERYGPAAAPNPWQRQHQYEILEQLPEPEDFELPPTSAAVRRGSSPWVAREGGSGDGGVVDDDDCVVQMELIDGISELSDMLDVSTTHDDSDYGYSNSNSSTDSFGEPIEHESGILAKTLASPPLPHDDDTAAAAVLTETFSRVALAPVMVIHQLSTPAYISPDTQHGPQTLLHSYSNRVAPVTVDQRLALRFSHPPATTTTTAAAAAADVVVATETLHSGHTNASTLTAPTSPDEHLSVAAAVTDQANVERGEALAAEIASGMEPTRAAAAASTSTSTAQNTLAAGTTAATAAAAAAAVTAANNMPLEIMELAGELEISLAREQEDYYSDNVSPANLDPMILQNLGKAVHQQCKLQRQNVQRRKSNMHLGLAGGATGGGSSSDEHGGTLTLADMQYDDYEQALKAMLVEVSQYFMQSGLNLVFPFSAKWVDWLTRHPDRPFPWRKDAEDDEEANRGSSGGDGEGGGSGGGGGGGDNDSDSQSDVSSFGEEPPALSRPLPPEDVLSKATIPMSKRRPMLVKDFVSQEKRKGINAHWQYYSVINQITAVASGIHRKLVVAEADADHSFVAHQLAALYQFLGGDFKKYKPGIESIFETIKQSLCDKTPSPTAAAHAPKETTSQRPPSATDVRAGGAGSGETPQAKVLDAKCVGVLREMMASIIADALYSTSRVAVAGKEQQALPNNTPTGGNINRAKQAAIQAQPVPMTATAVVAAAAAAAAGTATADGPAAREAGYAIATLKGLPTQPIIRYLTKEMRAVNGERRRRGLAHNLSRNNSIGHLRHHHNQFPFHTQQPPLPPDA
ncbi:hypothetical protein GGI04_001367 [Coemansia thaxteri]|nr:hypothetical protein GGI04_001367 [Coemansia thaxteri]